MKLYRSAHMSATARKHASLLSILLLGISCSHTQAWRVSGESIDALGKTFLATGAALDDAYRAGKVTEAQYERWRVFVKYFKPTYDVAADRWLHSDDSAGEHAAAVLAALSAELATFAAPGGKP